MRYLVRLGFCTVLAAAAGCANLNSIHRDNTLSKDKGEIVFTDAKQRGIISNQVKTKNTNGTVEESDDFEEYQLRICSEAAPDVFSAFATSAAGRASVDAATKSGSGAFSFASNETAATISRTQTVNLLREAMFRTCERFLNDAIDREELIVQSARDQRMIVSTLAIEQLTGVYTPAVTALLGNASSSTGGATAETVKLLADAKKASEAATAAAKKADDEAKTAEDDATKNGLNGKKDCEAVLQADDLNETQKAKCKTAKEKRDAHKPLKDKADAEKSYYERVQKLADQMGGTAASASGSAQITPAQAQAILSQNIEKVAASVERIVQSTFRFDELKMTCVIELRRSDRNIDDPLFRTCVQLLGDVTIRDIEADKQLMRILDDSISARNKNINTILACAFPDKNANKIADILTETKKTIKIPPGVMSVYNDFGAQTNADGVREALKDTPDITANLAFGASKACPK